jgi:hypothetical protein
MAEAGADLKLLREVENLDPGRFTLVENDDSRPVSAVSP